MHLFERRGGSPARHEPPPEERPRISTGGAVSILVASAVISCAVTLSIVALWGDSQERPVAAEVPVAPVVGPDTVPLPDPSTSSVSGAALAPTAPDPRPTINLSRNPDWYSGSRPWSALGEDARRELWALRLAYEETMREATQPAAYATRPSGQASEGEAVSAGSSRSTTSIRTIGPRTRSGAAW